MDLGGRGGPWNSRPSGSSSCSPTSPPPRTAQTEKTICSPGRPSATPRALPGLGPRRKTSLPQTTSSLWPSGWLSAWRPSPSALPKKEDVRTTTGGHWASLLDSRFPRSYKKRSEFQELVPPPSGQWHGSRNRGESIPPPWPQEHLCLSVLLAP